MFKWIFKGAKAVAAGQTQASLGLQSPHLPSAAVRVGRFAFGSAALWITGAWYSGFVNARTDPGSGPKLVWSGSPKNPVDRPNRKFNPKGTSGDYTTQDNASASPDSRQMVTTPGKAGRTLVMLGPDQLGVPGTAVAGFLWSAPNDEKQIPPFNRATYQSLVPVANSIARQFGLSITSGYRPGSGNLHSSGVAFDMVGNLSSMKRAAQWAASNPSLFQEIFVHNEGSGLHLHLGFYPDAAGIYNAAINKYVRPTGRAQPLAGH